MAEKQQIVNKADSSAQGKANTRGQPTCRFVGKTAGRIDLRLTLPKLHLATYKPTTQTQKFGFTLHTKYCGWFSDSMKLCNLI